MPDGKLRNVHLELHEAPCRRASRHDTRKAEHYEVSRWLDLTYFAEHAPRPRELLALETFNLARVVVEDIGDFVEALPVEAISPGS